MLRRSLLASLSTAAGNQTNMAEVQERKPLMSARGVKKIGDLQNMHVKFPLGIESEITAPVARKVEVTYSDLY